MARTAVQPLTRNDSAGFKPNLLYYLTLDNSLRDYRRKGLSIFSAGLGYRNLGPSALTGEKGVIISKSDNLQYTRGSKTQNNESVVYENLNPHQGTLEFWVRPNWNGDDGVEHFIFYEYGNSSNHLYLRKGSNNTLYFRIVAGGTVTYISSSTTSWTAGTWYHVVATWDSNNTVGGSDYSRIYVNGSATGQTSALGTAILVESNFDIGHQASGSQFNGTIAGRILNRPITSTEVTALYNSGNGSQDTFTVTPDCVWMGTFSD